MINAIWFAMVLFNTFSTDRQIRQEEKWEKVFEGEIEVQRPLQIAINPNRNEVAIGGQFLEVIDFNRDVKRNIKFGISNLGYSNSGKYMCLVGKAGGVSKKVVCELRDSETLTVIDRFNISLDTPLPRFSDDDKYVVFVREKRLVVRAIGRTKTVFEKDISNLPLEHGFGPPIGEILVEKSLRVFGVVATVDSREKMPQEATRPVGWPAHATFLFDVNIGGREIGDTRELKKAIIEDIERRQRCKLLVENGSGFPPDTIDDLGHRTFMGICYIASSMRPDGSLGALINERGTKFFVYKKLAEKLEKEE